MDSISSKNSKVYIVIVVYQMVQQLDLTMFLELFLRMIRERSKTHSRFGHYFYSNLYECAPMGLRHRLRTPNEGINQRYLINWADVAEKICCRHT